MAKTDKELAVELTIAVVKAKADIITSIQDNNSAKQTQLATALSDAVTTETFNQIYQAINSK